jgi:hypothetical protein
MTRRRPVALNVSIFMGVGRWAHLLPDGEERDPGGGGLRARVVELPEEQGDLQHAHQGHDDAVVDGLAVGLAPVETHGLGRDVERHQAVGAVQHALDLCRFILKGGR